jgi:GT2 family glycosyltransferase
MTTVSLLMPCYEPGRYLAPCLASAVPQLGAGDELLVQDACSGDGSAALLDRLAARDERVRVRHEPDSGQSDALNRALGRATGDLVGWLNADDLLLPAALDSVRAACSTRRELPDVVVGGWQVVDRDAAVLREKWAKRLDHGRLLRCGTYVFSGAMLVRRQLLVELGGYRVDLHYTMDYDLMLRLARAAGAQLLLPVPLAAVRVHGASKSAGPKARIVKDGFTVRRRHSRGWRDVAAAFAGTGFDLACQATYGFRYTEGYSRLRRRVRW